MNHIHKYILKNKNIFSNIVAQEIQKFAAISINERGVFNIVLCGGRTPIKIYEKLRFINTNWDCWNFWLSDERLYDQDSNLNVIKDNFLNYIPYRKNQINFFDTTNDFEKNLLFFNNKLKFIEQFDLCLLGIGEDGHVASLFPDLDWNKDDKNAFIVYNAPKLPSTRITLSLKRINQSRNIILIAGGIEKVHLLSKANVDLSLPFNSIKAIEKTSFYFSNE